MAYYDNELNIINDFISIPLEEILIFDKEGEDIINSIYDINNWSNSSGKNDPPPDMYSDKYNLMMDIMRVDDHATTNKKGKIFNSYRVKENKIFNEIKKWTKNNKINFNGNIIVNSITDLSTDEDHSYKKYLNEFSRVVKKHDDSNELYVQNHPTKSLIYFIFDESSAYFTSEEEKMISKAGETVHGKLHIFFYDKNFIDVLKKSKADYILWYAPFKQFRSLENAELPKAVILTKKYLKNIQNINYDITKMYSIEE